jgi:Arf-GAP with SH3 domain, ANK repeat and PH domain-containing protein
MNKVFAKNRLRFWIVLDQGRLSEYSNWKQKLDLHMDPIDLRMASVRMARDADRRFCFEVITPQFKRIYQATSEEDMSNWITAINNALQSAFEGRGLSSAPQTSQRDSSGRDIGSALTGKSSSYSGHHGYHTRDSSGVNRSITVGARPSYVRTNSNSFEEDPSKLLQQIRSADQGNTWCADCGSSTKVEWVSINLGIILCIECSGIHRSLGTHISKVRSLTLDTLSFTNDIVELLLLVGNRVSNMIWEANLDRNLKPSPQSNREQRLKFITAKYSERAYVLPISGTQSRFATADETLLASIKKNDIQGVLYGIALKANVNACDRSRNTHAVFLALAAADPAAPGSAGPSPSVSPNSKKTPSPGRPKAFPIAELLVQNGAEVPTQMPAIPLSAAAQLYIEQRTTQRMAVASPGNGDTLGALPTIQGGGTNTLAVMSERDSSRLQRRGNAGSRFAGKVAAFGER